MKYLVVLVTLVTLQVSASTGSWDKNFTPIFAADQPDITVDSMIHETEQFQQLASWTALQDRLISRKMELTDATDKYERAKKLYAAGAISLRELQLAEFVFQATEASVLEITGSIEQARLAATIAKLRVMDSGGLSSAQTRREIATLMKESQLYQKSTLESSRDRAMRILKYFKARADSGKILFDRGTISLVEYGQRQLDYQNANDQAQVYNYKINAAIQAIEGLERSLGKL